MSSALYYAKTLYNREHVYYLNNEMKLQQNGELKNLLNTFEAAGINNFFS